MRPSIKVGGRVILEGFEAQRALGELLERGLCEPDPEGEQGLYRLTPLGKEVAEELCKRTLVN